VPRERGFCTACKHHSVSLDAGRAPELASRNGNTRWVQILLEATFQASNGLPRKINRLAHYALLAAAVAKEKTVSAEHVTAALGEIS
jgi:hypothetical protein